MVETNETSQVNGAEAGQQDEGLYGAGAWNTVQAHTGVSSSNPGPKNVDIIRLAPDSNCPPATDHGSVGTLWHSYELTHRRVKKSGWTHQVTEREVPLSKEIAGHYVENTGTEDLIFLEMFAAPEFQEISFNNWLRSIPVQVAAAHTGLSAEEITSIPVKAEHLLGEGTQRRRGVCHVISQLERLGWSRSTK